MTTQAVNLTGLPIANTSSKGKRVNEGKETVGFPELIAQNTSTNANSSETKMDSSHKKVDITQKKDIIQETDSSYKQPEKVSNEMVQNTESELDIDDVSVTQVIETIQEIVSDELGITDEELNDLLESLQLTMLDLLQPQNLQQLLLAKDGEANPLAMLMDESLNNQWNHLTDQLSIASISEQLGIPKEDLQKSLDAMTIQTEASQSILAEALNPNDQTTEEPMLTDTNVDSDSHTEPTIVISRDSQNASQSSDNSSDQMDTKSHVENLVARGNTMETAHSPEELVHTFSAQLQKQMDLGLVPEELSSQPSMREIVDQVVEQIKVLIRPESTGMELQLNPQHLGRVNLSIEWKAGAATASFSVQNETTKEALLGQISTLRENLEQQGLKVENVEVNVTEFAFSQSNDSDTTKEQGKKNRSNSRGLRLGPDEGKAMAESEMVSQETNQSGMDAGPGENIDFTA